MSLSSPLRQLFPSLGCLLILLLTVPSLFAVDLTIARRHEQYIADYGWIAAPYPLILPGIGTALGGFVQLSNINNTPTDLTVAAFTGDFDAIFTQLQELYLYPKLVSVDLGSGQGRFPFNQYDRGIESAADSYVTMDATGQFNFGQLRTTLWERRIELSLNFFKGKQQVHRILDPDGKEIGDAEQDEFAFEGLMATAILDYTDDWVDPHKGVRTGTRYIFPQAGTDPFSSEYQKNDYDFTYYLPTVGDSNLVFNFFRSYAAVTSQASTDYAELQQVLGLGCGYLPAEQQPKCTAVEHKQISERIALNKYGNATALGGPNRMRAYPMGRFYAGNTVYYGTEYRWNLPETRTPIDWYLLGGIRTTIQYVFFAELGTVNDDPGKLNEHLKSSYGGGIRTIISGTVFRAELAFGEEGVVPTIFIDYPMALNPLAEM